ncbi:MAG TPA: OmpA family protein [Hymenobacter sp.]|jgi:outer membrane protein OmpA-like peptidoglycan-associated protein|uniref:OmpA family protein n=1 Tax=Hymenobacter sp. TaxID=1898978 RepID=UPI002ED81F7D
METGLVEKVKFCFTGEVITQLSYQVGEAEEGVERALSKAVPLLLNGLLRQLERGGAAPADLLHLAREADAAQVLKQLSASRTAQWYERGTNLLLDLLGHTYRITVNEIAEEAGIRPEASGTLLQVAATAVLGVLGRFAVENDITANEFHNWLKSQKAAIGRALLPPPSFATRGAAAPLPPTEAPEKPLAQLPPRPAPAPSTSTSTSTSTQMTAPRNEAVAAPPVAPQPAPVPTGGLRWQWGVLLLLAVAMGYVFGSGLLGRPRSSTVALDTSVDASVGAADAAVVSDAPAPAAPVRAEEPAAQPAAVATPAVAVPAAAPLRAAPRPYAAAPAAGTATAAGRYDQNRDTYVYDTGRPIVLALAKGVNLRVGANSTENRLYTFLASAAVQVDSVNRTKGWISLDRVYFEPAKATLTPESSTQLRNIASILKTFPQAMVKIGGYTDSTGNSLQNFQLSEERARAAMLSIAKLGIPLERMQAKGYGARYFLVPNNTPTSRAQNRRVSIRVIKK